MPTQMPASTSGVTQMDTMVVAECSNHNELLPLHAYMEQMLRHYFAHLEGEMPSNLYELIVHQVEKPLLTVTLEKADGNQSRCAQMLGINRGTLRKKMKLHGLI